MPPERKRDPQNTFLPGFQEGGIINKIIEKVQKGVPRTEKEIAFIISKVAKRNTGKEELSPDEKRLLQVLKDNE